MDKKLRVGIVFGGKSPEHEVALQSAKNIINAADRSKYDLTLIGVDKQGKWFLMDESKYLINDDDPKHIELSKSEKVIALLPGTEEMQLYNVSDNKTLEKLDVIFPVIHGTNGEDGTIQGLLKLIDIPFVGPSVLASAVGMDKDVAKRLLRDAGIPIAKFVTVSKKNFKSINYKQIEEELGLPVFIKPANMGSSVGVSKAKTYAEIEDALANALKYDNKVLIEQYINGREVECAVLGNEDPAASIVGEVIPIKDFYSYEAKYIDENGAMLKIPAKIDDSTMEKIQGTAISTYKVLCCEGMTRVDCFLDKNNQVIVNEVNTIPGFTKISMYPKLWGESGIPYTELIDRLIELAIERHKRDAELKNAVNM